MEEESATKKYDLVVLGELPLDVILDVHPPIERPGGAAYSACAAVKRGAKVAILGEVGNDEIGGFLNELRLLDIDIQGVLEREAKGLTYFISNSDEVVPQVVTSQGPYYTPDYSWITSGEVINTRSLLIYPSSSYPQQPLTKLAQLVNESGGKVFLDLQHDIENINDWEPIISQCSAVFASRQELLEYTGVESEAEAVQRLFDLATATVVVKYGIGGSAIYSRGTEPLLIPAYLTQFKCTIGAGDVFNAVFILHYLDDSNLEGVGKKASVATSVFIENVAFQEYVTALASLDFESEWTRRQGVNAPPEKLSEIQIYVAGHFSSTPMRRWANDVMRALAIRGFHIVSPCNPTDMTRAECFKADLENITDAQILVVLLDDLGRGGLAWELGYAYAKGIPIFGLSTNPWKRYSHMVEESCNSIVSTIPRLLNELFSSLDRVLTSGTKSQNKL